jgi:predicted ATP-dependent protease
MRAVIVPRENANDVPSDLRGMEVSLVADVREALAALGVEQVPTA